MKKQLYFLIMMLGIAFPGLSQENSEEKKPTNYGTSNHFQVDLGINDYLENNDFPAQNDAIYAVKPFGSWYVALRSVNDTHVHGALHILWGIDVSWYNFKFENDALRLSKQPGGVEFSEDPRDVSALKSKLTATYLNASLVPMLRFGQSKGHHHSWMEWCGDREKEGFRIGAGAYGGYKIGSYAKYVVEETGDKKRDKDKGSFYLNNLRYGLRFQAGYRGVDVFANYDLNELFAEDRGPELHAFSFGVML